MPSLINTAVILLPLCSLFHIEAAPLHLELPHILKDPTFSDKDDTYGPWEKNSWIGNQHPDDLHHDDLWPPMVPPRAAIRRDEPVLKAILPKAEIHITDHALSKVCFHKYSTDSKGPLLLHDCHRCTGQPRGPTDSPTLSIPTIVNTIITKETSRTLTTSGHTTSLYIGAQQWQEYWDHKPAVTSIPALGALPEVKTTKPTLAKVDASSSMSVTREAIAASTGISLSTGAQQSQVYWDHVVTRQILTEEAKFYLFAKVFGLPEHLTAAMVVLSQALIRVNHYPQIYSQDTQHPGPVAAMFMCDAVGQTLTQGGHQTNKASSSLTEAIKTTCRSLAQLYPQHKVQTQGILMSQRVIIAKMFHLLGNTNQTELYCTETTSKEVLIKLLVSGGNLNESRSRHTSAAEHIEPRSISSSTTISRAESPREIEIHTSQYSKTPNHASSSSPILIHSASTTHHNELHPRDAYLFQPLEQAYTWLNDIYDTATNMHPRYPYHDPEQHINGCIYYPSPDRAAITGKVICPPGK